MRRRTKEELVRDIQLFLDELYACFSEEKKIVLFVELNIQKRAAKYRINGRIHREVIRNVFNEANRYYSRKFDTPVSNDVIVNCIDNAHNKRSNEYQKNKELHLIKKKNAELEREAKRKIKEEGIAKFNHEFNKALPALKNYCRTITSDYEDLVQETYVEAHSVYERYKLNTNISAWLIQIAINLNLMKLKKERFKLDGVSYKKVTFLPELNDDVLYLIDEVDNLDDKYPENTIEVVNECLNELNPVHKKHLELFMSGASHKEIGEIMDIDEKYSKTRLRLIRIALAKKIKSKINISIKSYAETDPYEYVNRNAQKKSYYQRNKNK